MKSTPLDQATAEMLADICPWHAEAHLSENGDWTVSTVRTGYVVALVRKDPGSNVRVWYSDGWPE